VRTAADGFPTLMRRGVRPSLRSSLCISRIRIKKEKGVNVNSIDTKNDGERIFKSGKWLGDTAVSPYRFFENLRLVVDCIGLCTVTVQYYCNQTCVLVRPSLHHFV
jgi:hypothetical protein